MYPVQTAQQKVEILQVPFLGLVLDMPVVMHRQASRPCDYAATSSSGVTVGCPISDHRQSAGFSVVRRDRYCGANCGDFTGAVLEQGVRGLRVLAHRQGRRCASGQFNSLARHLH